RRADVPPVPGPPRRSASRYAGDRSSLETNCLCSERYAGATPPDPSHGPAIDLDRRFSTSCAAESRLRSSGTTVRPDATLFQRPAHAAPPRRARAACAREGRIYVATTARDAGREGLARDFEVACRTRSARKAP